MPDKTPDLADWRSLIERIRRPQPTIRIAIVGKYVMLSDAYISVVESLKHGGAKVGCNVQIKWVLSEDIEKNGCAEYLQDVHGILVPGGFGDRGIEGKIKAAEYARTRGIPFLGLCLGMQVAVIEFARNVAKMTGAHSTEFAPDSPYPVIDLMPDQHNIVNKGGTMRLGRFPCHLQAGTISAALYKEPVIYERHRHRYEVNNTFREELKKHGMVFAGISPDDRLVEMIELTNHPYFVACQFHPELKSRPDRPHPLFVGFVDASLNHSEAAEKKELDSASDVGDPATAAQAVSTAQEKAAPIK